MNLEQFKQLGSDLKDIIIQFHESPAFVAVAGILAGLNTSKRIFSD